MQPCGDLIVTRTLECFTPRSRLFTWNAENEHTGNKLAKLEYARAQNLHFKSISVAHLKVNVRGKKVEGFEYEVWDDNQGGWCDEARLPPGVRPLCAGEL